jgi:transcriptional regulator with XRE-family HTH domain
MASQGCAAYMAANLKRCRAAAGISQGEVGERAGLHRTEVGLLERGSRTPKIDTLIKLAAALEIEPRELLAGIEWTPSEVEVVERRAAGFSMSQQEPEKEGQP